MTNGTRLQAADAVGIPQPTDPQPAVPPPAGGGRLAVVRVKPKRTSLAVIPRRATGTHTALTALPVTAPAAGTQDPRTQDVGTEELTRDLRGQDFRWPDAPAGASRRIRLLGGAAALLALAVAIPLWVDHARPTATVRQVAPVAAALPGAPVTGVEPSGAATAPAGPVDEADQDGTPPGGVPSDAPRASATPSTADPDATQTTAPQANTPTAEPTDPATQEPPDATPPRAPADRGRANIAGRNLAFDRPIFASSFANRLRSPAQAVDGNLLSRWSTRATNAQWIAVDLGDNWRISRVRIAWELAYADTYRVDLSADGRTWTPVWQTRAGLGGTVGVPLDGATARYVRVFGVKPAGPFGYSIRELDVR